MHEFNLPFAEALAVDSGFSHPNKQYSEQLAKVQRVASYQQNAHPSLNPIINDRVNNWCACFPAPCDVRSPNC